MGHIGNRRGFEKLEKPSKDRSPAARILQGRNFDHKHPYEHFRTDRCLHKVFNYLWVRNPEPIDIPDPHDHHHSQVMQMQPHSSINVDDIIEYEPMWPVQDGPNNEMAAGTLAEQLQAMVERL